MNEVQTPIITDLQGNLLAACPPNSDGHVSVRILADKLGLTTACLYKWVSDGRVPPQRVQQIVDLQQQHFGEVRIDKARLNPLFE